MGAGDQLYNDNLWILPPLQEWLKREDKLEYQPDKTMKQAISDYYCGAYLRHTHYHPAAPMLRNTPQVRLQSKGAHTTHNGPSGSERKINGLTCGAALTAVLHIWPHKNLQSSLPAELVLSVQLRSTMTHRFCLISTSPAFIDIQSKAECSH